eukprot:TRINITY_DN2593_c0_g1_i2.p1 TRINITY_DN2593_c0_g1~~TRINITY_DN2593_c0_g1_i2.p1  ORF type:complete len:238 (+),score=62.79 TRINITY_DN2593_c0_g1_i2:119-832(+)
MTTTITAAAAAAAPQQPQSHDVAPPTTTAAAAVVVAGTDENTSGAETDVKHPLQASWVMWYDNSSKSRLSAADWDKSLCSIFEFRFVEDFWGMYNNLAQLSEVSLGSNYSMFKAGIRPSWEDVSNKDGGKWTITFTKGSPPHLPLDTMWLNLLLACIGEQFEAYSDQINGCVVSVRKQFEHISLWTKDARDENVLLGIGAIFKRTLGLPATTTIAYSVHKDSLVKGSSYGVKKNLEL